MSRRFAVLVGVIAMFGLGGCSPERKPYFAVALVADRPTLLIAGCALGEVSSVTLWEIDRAASPAPATEPGPPPYPDWSVWAPVPPASPGGQRPSVPDPPARLELLGPAPPGWQERPFGSLREFREDREYRVHGSGHTTSVTFTLARLRELAPGDVLSALNDAERVVSEEDFQERARKFC